VVKTLDSFQGILSSNLKKVKIGLTSKPSNLSLGNFQKWSVYGNLELENMLKNKTCSCKFLARIKIFYQSSKYLNC